MLTRVNTLIEEFENEQKQSKNISSDECRESNEYEPPSAEFLKTV